jgi:hypothetical protein
LGAALQMLIAAKILNVTHFKYFSFYACFVWCIYSIGVIDYVVGFEVLNGDKHEVTVFWVIVPCSVVELY